MLATIRDVFSAGGPRSREDALREVGAVLDYQRIGHRIRAALNRDIQTAVRRGILANTGGQYSLLCRHIAQYEPEAFKSAIRIALRRGLLERDASSSQYIRRTRPR